MTNENTSPECRLVEDYFDQPLTESVGERFREHLAHCSGCQAELEALHKADHDLATAWNQVVLPAVDISKVTLPQTSLNQRSDSLAAPATRWPTWQIAVAVLVLVLGGLLAALGRSGDPDLAEQGVTPEPQVIPESMVATEASRRSSPTAIVNGQAMFALAQFAEPTLAEPAGSLPELTVYNVVPVNTYISSNPEQP